CHVRQNQSPSLWNVQQSGDQCGCTRVNHKLAVERSFDGELSFMREWGIRYCSAVVAHRRRASGLKVRLILAQRAAAKACSPSVNALLCGGDKAGSTVISFFSCLSRATALSSPEPSLRF